MTRVLFVFGTRPEAIKLAPVIKEAGDRPGIESIVCSTGQHRRMLDEVVEVFGLKVDYDLDVMREGQSLSEVAATVLTGLDRVLADVSPDAVVVQGDTTSAMAGALSAYYRRVGVAHVEAGLQTGDKYNPYPEEGNRQIIGRIADLHFAPTRVAADRLISQGVDANSVHVTGNTVVDAVQWAANVVEEQGVAGLIARGQIATVPNVLIKALGGGARGGRTSRRLILVTGHRRESFGADLLSICRAVKSLVERNSDIEIAYPVHFNPNVRSAVFGELADVDRVHLFDPPPYLGFVWLMMRSYLILTDSGGIQEEAPSLNRPVLVMRRVTERPEGIDSGCSRLVGVDTDQIVNETEKLLNDSDQYDRMCEAENPYGDGAASHRIVLELEKWGRQVG